jgi:hypothetical protein
MEYIYNMEGVIEYAIVQEKKLGLFSLARISTLCTYTIS